MIIEDAGALVWSVVILCFVSVIVASTGWIIACIARDAFVILVGGKDELEHKALHGDVALDEKDPK